MVKHVILWQLKDEISDEEKKIIKKEIKEGLEGLVGREKLVWSFEDIWESHAEYWHGFFCYPQKIATCVM